MPNMMTANQGMPAYQVRNPSTGQVDWSGLLSSLGTGAGLYAQGNAQNNSASLANQYTRATGTLNPFGASAPGGFSAGMNNGNVNLNYGAFNPAYGNLAGASGGASDTAGGITAPSGLNGALNGAFGQAASGLGGFAPGGAGFAANNAFLGAGNAASAAGMPQQDMMQNYMKQLQELQAPGIQQQTDQLQGSLFGNGQMGTNSGGFLARQFGQGLASQNTQNALAASQLGLQGQQVAANTAGTLGGLGNNLLSSAFSNFGGAAGLPAGLQGQYLNNAGTGIGAAGQLTNQGLGLYNAGLQTSLGQNQASSRAGYLASNNANSANQQSPFGQLAAGMFGSAGGQQALQSVLGKIPGLGQYFGGTPDLSVPGAGQGGNAGYITDPGASSAFGTGGASGMMPGGGGVGMLSDMFGGSAGAGAVGTGSVLAGGADLGSIGSAGAGGMFDFSSMLGSGGAAASDLAGFGTAAGTGTAGVGGGSLGATGFGADMAGGEAGMGGSLGASGGGGSSAGTAGLAAAWPVAAAAAGLIGTKMIFDNNSKYSPSAYMGDVSNTIAGLKAQASDPKNAASRDLLLQRAQQYQTMLDKLKSGKQSFSSQLPSASGGAAAMLGRYTKKV